MQRMQQGRQKQLSTDVETWPTNFTHNFTLCGNISGTKRKASWRVSLYLGEPSNRALFALTRCAGVCVSAESCHIYCLAVPPAATLLQPLPCSLLLPLSLMLTSTASGKIQLGVACAAFGASKIIALCFSLLLCVCVCFLFVSFCLSRGEGKCVSIVALRMNHAHFKLIYSTVAF